jgi:hypothetical protein
MLIARLAVFGADLWMILVLLAGALSRRDGSATGRGVTSPAHPPSCRW